MLAAFISKMVILSMSSPRDIGASISIGISLVCVGGSSMAWCADSSKNPAPEEHAYFKLQAISFSDFKLNTLRNTSVAGQKPVNDC
jgi:hypothetical protein